MRKAYLATFVLIVVTLLSRQSGAQIGLQSLTSEGIISGTQLQVIGQAYTYNYYGIDLYPYVGTLCDLYSPSDQEYPNNEGTGTTYAYSPCYTPVTVAGGWTEESYHVVYYDVDVDGGYYDPEGVADYADADAIWCDGDPSCIFYYSGSGEDNSGLPEDGDVLGQTHADLDVALVSVQVTPMNTTLESGDTVELSASVANTAGQSQAVAWTIVSPGVGSLTGANSDSVTYNAPATIDSSSTVTVKACSVISTGQCGTASISLQPVTITSVTATPNVLLAGSDSTSSLYATLSNDSSDNVSLTWQPTANINSSQPSLGATYTPPAASSISFSGSNVFMQPITATITGSSPAVSNGTMIALVQPVAITGVAGTLVAGSSSNLTVTGTGFSTATGVTTASFTNASWGSLTVNSVSVTSNVQMIINVSVPLNPINEASQNVTLTVTSGYQSVSGSSQFQVPVAGLTYTYTIAAAPTSASLAYGESQAFVPVITCKLSTGASCTTPQTATYQIINGTGSLSATSGTGSTFTSTLQSATSSSATIQICAIISTSTCTDATVNLLPTLLTLSPNTVTLQAGKTQAYTANISNAGTASQVAWQLSSSVGSLSSTTTSITVNGSNATATSAYTAPSPIPNSETVNLTACMLPGETVCSTVPVTLQPVSVTVSPTTATVQAGQQQYFSAQVMGSSNTNVTWSITGTAHGSITSGGIYTAPTTVSGTESDTVVATSTADTTKSASAVVSIALDATNTSLSSSATTVQQGQTVTLTADVRQTNGSGTPTGTVAFAATSSLSGVTTTIATVTLSGGIATYAYTPGSGVSGQFSVAATYNGDSGNAASKSSGVLVIVEAPTTTTITASPSPVTIGQNVTITVSVSQTGSAYVPTGTVTLASGTTNIGTSSLTSGSASFVVNTASYPVGTYPLVATYSGDSYDEPSTSGTYNESVDYATTTTLTASPSAISSGQVVTLTATVVRSGHTGYPTGSVAYSIVGGPSLGTVTLTNGVAQLNVIDSNFPAGTYVITADYTGDTSDQTSTGTVSETVE